MCDRPKGGPIAHLCAISQKPRDATKSKVHSSSPVTSSVPGPSSGASLRAASCVQHRGWREWVRGGAWSGGKGGRGGERLLQCELSTAARHTTAAGQQSNCGGAHWAFSPPMIAPAPSPCTRPQCTLLAPVPHTHVLDPHEGDLLAGHHEGGGGVRGGPDQARVVHFLLRGWGCAVCGPECCKVLTTSGVSSDEHSMPCSSQWLCRTRSLASALMTMLSYCCHVGTGVL
jgi:hypothetical protein